MKKNYGLLFVFMVVGYSLMAQSTSATVGAFHSKTENGVTVIASIQPMASINTTNGVSTITGWFPFIFSGMSTNVNDFLLEDDLYLGPNPAQHEISIQSTSKGDAVWQVMLHNINGKLLGKHTWAAYQEQFSLDIGPLSTGTFFLVFHNPAAGKHRMEKFIKID